MSSIKKFEEFIKERVVKMQKNTTHLYTGVTIQLLW